MNKPSKVEEASTPYSAKKPVRAATSSKPRTVATDDAAFKRITDKIFSDRKELLRKLAQ